MNRVAALLAVAALALCGCGSSSLSTRQLRSAATRICTTATRRIDRIPTPTSPAGGELFLQQGIAAVTPELTALRKLAAPNDLKQAYSTALRATTQELQALRTTLRQLQAGGDPVILIKTLQQRIAPLETQANAAWQTLEITACLNR